MSPRTSPAQPSGGLGDVLGMTSAVAGALYIGLGWLQHAIGLEARSAVGFLMVVPAALIALVVLLRRPDVAR